MRVALFLSLLVIFIASCVSHSSYQPQNRNLEIIESRSLDPYAEIFNNEVSPSKVNPSKSSRDFLHNEIQGFLYDRLHKINPTLPEWPEVEKCISSFFAYRRPGDYSVMIPMAICFDSTSSLEICPQLANNLRRYSSAITHNSDRYVILFIPDSVINGALASRRIQIIREFLILEGIEPERIIEIEGDPPE